MREWTDFGVRESMSTSARSPIREMPEVAQIFSAFLAETDAALAEPFRGVTTDGVVRGRTPWRTSMATESIPSAAASFLASLDTPSLTRVTFPFHSTSWRSCFPPLFIPFPPRVLLLSFPLASPPPPSVGHPDSQPGGLEHEVHLGQLAPLFVSAFLWLAFFVPSGALPGRNFRAVFHGPN